MTFISFSIILTSVLLEFVDYRRIRLEPSLEVDRSRGEKLVIEMDIEFPRVPCYMLSLDVMDLSGERQHDVTHDMSKQRISADGTYLEEKRMGQLKGDVERAAQNKDPNYCGSCYGASPPENGCCNSCEDVRQAYVRQGWSFVNPDGIEQCVEEGWSDKMEQQNEEGCRLSGQVRVNKVIGNLHFSYGSTFMRHGMNIAELVPYLKDKNHHDFGHRIIKFHFGADVTPAEKARMEPKEMKTRRALHISDPLQGRQNHRHEGESSGRAGRGLGAGRQPEDAVGANDPRGHVRCRRGRCLEEQSCDALLAVSPQSRLSQLSEMPRADPRQHKLHVPDLCQGRLDDVCVPERRRDPDEPVLGDVVRARPRAGQPAQPGRRRARDEPPHAGHPGRVHQL